MNRDQKAELVEELAGQLQGAETVFAVDYRGISVAQAAELRRRLRDAQAVFRIVKNSLTERASDAAGIPELKEMLDGPTALTFVAGDAAVAAKALNDAARLFGTLDFKGGLMNGSPLTPDDVRTIARLPSRDVLHGQLVGTVAAPLTGLVRTLNALIAGLALQLGQIAEQGLVGGDAPPAEEAPPEAVEAEAAPAPAAEAEAEAATEKTPEPEQTETDASDSEPSEEPKEETE